MPKISSKAETTQGFKPRQSGSKDQVFFFFWRGGLFRAGCSHPRLGVESELQLPAYTTATTMQDPSLNLYHNSWQRWILNPLIKARDKTHNLMVTHWIHFCCATKGTPKTRFLSTNLVTFFFFLFRTPTVAYGSSQATGPIRATAANLHHSSQCLQDP